MCKAFTKLGVKCGLARNKELCHIHQAQQDKLDLDQTRTELLLIRPDAIAYKLINTPKQKIKNKVIFNTKNQCSYTLASRTAELRANEVLLDIERNRVNELQNQVQELEAQLAKVKHMQEAQLAKALQKQKDQLTNSTRMQEAQLKKAKQKQEALFEGYQAYQTIIQYERQKSELIDKNINIYTYENSDFHKLRWKRNLLAHANLN